MQTISINSSENTQIITPSKIICIGRNYVDHIHELGNDIPDEMVVFFKPNSAISTQLNAVHQYEPLHYEGELCFVYQQGRFSAIGFGLDLTKRGIQSQLKAKGLPWERAKAFDGAAVFSHFVALKNSDDDFCLSLSINTEKRQEGGTELMMYKPAQILKELQTFITLEDGDVVMTGTPKGVGVINVGDKFSAQICQGSNVTIKEKILLSCEWLAQ
ncbi:MAG: fumarylacetoacetate hydrolase family protein [Colwellia sp.]